MVVYGHVLETLLLVGLTLFVTTCGVLIWRLLRCVHQWELVDKTELPSSVETMAKNGVSFSRIWASDIPGLTIKTVILAMRCPKCGAAKIWKSNS